MQGIKFVALSGAGWLLDLAAFSIAVAVLGAPAGLAAFISATFGAMAVYWFARSLVFGRRERGFSPDVLVYLGYTLGSIVFWSACIHALSDLLHVGLFEAYPFAAIAAKLMVTPLSLAFNFLIASVLARRPAREPRSSKVSQFS